MFNKKSQYTFPLIVLFFLMVFKGWSQGVLPIHRYMYTDSTTSEVVHPEALTLGFSLRLMSKGYRGASVKIRRGNDNAEADVFFDSLGVVSVNSSVVITNTGSSSLSLNQELSYNTFASTNTIYVTTWYHQGSDPSFDAVQTNTSQQPLLQLNTAGPSNTLPSIRFTGDDFLNVFKPVEDVLGGSFRGSFLVVLKTIQNKAHFTFGVKTSTNWRWAFHINWSNGRAYFDSGEICCVNPRSYINNLNVWNQYTFIRGNLVKLARVNGANTEINSTNTPTIARTGTISPESFQIGSASGDSRCFNGYMSEVIMYPSELPSSKYSDLEQNQITYWGL